MRFEFEKWSRLAIAVMAASALAGCYRVDGPNGGHDAGSDADGDSDSDTEPDSDSETDADTDSGSETGLADECVLGTHAGSASITNSSHLEDYRGYTAIQGDLLILSPLCHTLEALHCLEHVTGDVEISGTYNLTDLDGLDSLSSIGNQLRLGNMAGMYGNKTLSDIGALASLEEVDSLTIYLNSSLSSLAGLEGVTSLNVLHVEGNEVLTSLDGLSGVADIGYALMAFNDSLPDCEICELWYQAGAEPESFFLMDNLADECTPFPDNCP